MKPKGNRNGKEQTNNFHLKIGKKTQKSPCDSQVINGKYRLIIKKKLVLFYIKQSYNLLKIYIKYIKLSKINRIEAQ